MPRDSHHRPYSPGVPPVKCDNCITIGKRLDEEIGKRKDYWSILKTRTDQVKTLKKLNHELVDIAHTMQDVCKAAEEKITPLLAALEEIRNERKSFGACPGIADRALKDFYGPGRNSI